MVFFPCVECGQIGELVVEGLLGVELCFEHGGVHQSGKFVGCALEEFRAQCVWSSCFANFHFSELSSESRECDAVGGITGSCGWE